MKVLEIAIKILQVRWENVRNIFKLASHYYGLLGFVFDENQIEYMI